VTRTIGYAIQALQPNQRVLVLGSVAGVRNGHGWFTVDELAALFDALRLPSPGSVARSLGQLRGSDVVRTRQDSSWALTPKGEAQVAEITGELDYGLIAAEMAGTPGSVFANARHPTIPPTLAPARWHVGIARLLDRYPFEKNVLCMTRFPRDDAPLPDPIAAVIERLKSAIAAHGLTLHLASDHLAEPELFGNVGAYMWACNYGIGLLENRLEKAEGLNDNVLIELGSMSIIGRQCAILRDRTSPTPPTDLSGHIYKSVDFDDLDGVEAAAHRWAVDDLGLDRCGGCP
jgi:hypothetical protein